MDLKTFIFELFGARERHELPAKMMAALLDDDERSAIVDRFLFAYPDQDHDYLRDFFQETMAERNDLMQDYTPAGICQLVAGITGDRKRIADVCAGTGSLTMAAWEKNKGSEFVCFELSTAALPFLLFNITLRQMKATVIHGDVLMADYEHIYQCENGQIKEVNQLPDLSFDAVISNPPYSLKWDMHKDKRFGDYPLPPKKAADYAFVLICLSMLKPDGICTCILPHGVLFRGNAEAKCRQRLIEERKLYAVIGLADKLFAKTQIPVCLAVFKSGADAVHVVNADKIFKHVSKQNELEPDHVETILNAYKMRRGIDYLAHLASYNEIKENDYNLNIPRYCCSTPPEPPVDILATMDDIIEIDRQIKATNTALLDMMGQLKGTNEAAQIEHELLMEKMRTWLL